MTQCAHHMGDPRDVASGIITDAGVGYVVIHLPQSAIQLTPPQCSCERPSPTLL